MGTTVSSLQILGVPEQTVRDALPRALVGQWSARFVTACPDLAFQGLERKASALSKKLGCTVLSVSMFDGDTLSLVIFQGGKRLTRHSVNPESGENTAGNPKLFCAALGLPEALAPKLKRLFAAFEMQEEKLGILQALLGAPLFLRYGGEEEGLLPEGPIEAGSGPLEEWAREHPEPPKIKNQCRAELIQEIPEKTDACSHGSNITILHSPRRFTEEDIEDYGDIFKVGEVWGECNDDLGACPLADGRLELIPLLQPEITLEQYRAAFHREPPELDYFHFDYAYTYQNGRVVTTSALFEADPAFPGSFRGVQTALLHDTAGILPCPFALTLEGEPALLAGFGPSDSLRLLPDGGFLAAVRSRADGPRLPKKLRASTLARYGPDGVQLWTAPEIEHICGVGGSRVYAVSGDGPAGDQRLLAVDMDGNVTARCSVPRSPHGPSKICFVSGIPYYIVESPHFRGDDLLCRLTLDLRPDGEAAVPDMADQLSYLLPSHDGTLLYAVGYKSSLRVIDAENLRVVCDLPKKEWLRAAAVDGRNRLWVGCGAYAECYTPELELVSHHRLKGEIISLHRNDDGQMCAVTFQKKTYMIRVYCFS